MHRSIPSICALMLTIACFSFITGIGAPADTDNVSSSAVVHSLEVSPQVCVSDDNVSVSALIGVSGNDRLIDAEYFVVPRGSSPGESGSGYHMETENHPQDRNKLYTATFIPSELGLLPGKYDIHVHGYSMSTQGGITMVWGDFEDVPMEILHNGPLVIVGPEISPANLTISSNNFTLTATISDADTGGSYISNAEYFVNEVGLSGTGVPMSFVNGGADEVVEEVFSIISMENFLDAHGPGNHIVYVHGKDLSNSWGPFESVSFFITDDAGPVVESLLVSPDPTDGALEVEVTCFADDRDTGGSVIFNAELFVYPAPGPGETPADTPGTGIPLLPVDGEFNQPRKELFAILNLAGYSLDDYVIYVRAMDAAENWGPFSQITLTINDNTPPEFGGLQGIGNTGDGTSLKLWWNTASDMSIPVTYNIYISPLSPGNYEFATPSATTQSTSYTYTGLTEGTMYYFVVRAEDAMGNEDSNAVELGETPLVDVTPPVFAG
ncbi:MAG TPA: fibronectin type III domain-containing protein, partial [Euryarchaeota archaeon]|nr:fibronectin type III domain-containing protein [Euryarchaeota archaeon]